MLFAQLFLLALLGYAGCGLVVGIPFVCVGVDRVDDSARGTSWMFRLLILPGVVALWPLMAVKWLRSPAMKGHP